MSYAIIMRWYLLISVEWIMSLSGSYKVDLSQIAIHNLKMDYNVIVILYFT